MAAIILHGSLTSMPCILPHISNKRFSSSSFFPSPLATVDCWHLSSFQTTSEKRRKMEITSSPQQAHVHPPRCMDDIENQTDSRQISGTRKPPSGWLTSKTAFRNITMITHHLEQKPRLMDHDSIDSREPLDLTEPSVHEPNSTSPAALASLLRHRDRMGGRSSMSHQQGERQQFRHKLGEWLDAFTQPGCSVLLLCKGNQEDCHIIPVSIQDSADPNEQWKQAQKSWNNRKGMLRSIFHWYQVTSIEMAGVSLVPTSNASDHALLTRFKITIVGRRSPGYLGEYVGLYQAEDLKSKICELEGQGAEYYNNSFYCEPDMTYRSRIHADKCPSTFGEFGLGWECPYSEHDEAQRKLALLKRRSMMKLIFRDPDLAKLHFSMDELGLLTSHRYVPLYAGFETYSS